MLQDELAHLGMVLAEDAHDLLGLGGLREGGEAPQVQEHHGHLPPMALERVLRVASHDQLRELRREEALEPSQAVELRHLLPHALFQRLVPLRELGRLQLDGVVEVLDPDQRADARQELRLIHGLGQEVVGPGLEPADPLLRGIEGGHHHHGQDPRGGVVADLATHLVPAHLRHHHVQEHQVGRFLLHLEERLGPRGGRCHGIALRLEQVGQQLDVLGQIVDDQDPGGSAHARSPAAGRRSSI